MKLEEWQIALRKLQAEKETFAIRMVDEQYAPGEFRVVNAATRSEYKVVYRGKDSQWNYCSCYDFKTSQLGTCKHMEAVKLWVRKKRKKVQVAEPDYSSVYIDYKGPRRVKIRIGDHGREMLERLAKDYFDELGVLREDAYARFDVFVQAAKAIAPDFRCYDDALDYVLERRDRIKRCRLLEENTRTNISTKCSLCRSIPTKGGDALRRACRQGHHCRRDGTGQDVAGHRLGRGLSA